jgi:hypothetical protein
MKDRQLRGMLVGTTAFLVIYLIVNIFKIGGDGFIFSLANGLNASLALIVALFSLTLWRDVGVHVQSQRLWAGLIAGWSLWALAEVIWAVASILGQEIPYPSLADLFWVLGYLPIGFGLISRIRSLPTRMNWLQWLILVALSLGILGLTIPFIFIPILLDFDAGRLLESVLNVLYPLLDLFLMILILRLFFAVETGVHRFGWQLLTSGFLLMTFSDLLFTYADWNGIYYPDMKATLLSRLGVDATYAASFLVWFAGLYTLRLLMRAPEPVQAILPPKRLPNYGHVLLTTGKEDRILSASPNVKYLFKDEALQGKALADLLAIPEKDSETLLDRLRSEGRVADLLISVRSPEGSPRGTRLCGLAVRDAQKEYLGGNFVLRIPVEQEYYDYPLSQESRDMVWYILEKSGSNYTAEIGLFLLDYHLVYLRTLFQMASHQGGMVMTQSLLKELKESAARNQWKLLFNAETGVQKTQYPLGVLREALPVLLQTAKAFVTRLTDAETVETRMRDLDAQMDASLHADVQRYLRPEQATQT